MSRYTLILGAILIFLALILFICIKMRKKNELKRIERRANYLANSERARHIKKTV